MIIYYFFTAMFPFSLPCADRTVTRENSHIYLPIRQPASPRAIRSHNNNVTSCKQENSACYYRYPGENRIRIMDLKRFLLFAASASLLVNFSFGCCPNACSGHGECTGGTCTCSCYSQFTGNDCSERACPLGYAWSGDAAGTDDIHSPLVECSNAGSCSRSTGLCTCQNGFEGMACERMTCPSDCNNHGMCVSLKQAAEIKDDRNFFRQVTYSQWDSTKIFGCLCDLGYEGYDCGIRTCPYGDDPLTLSAGQDEVWTLDCQCDTACAGSFTITFGSEKTAFLDHTTTPATLESELEGLTGIRSALTVSGGAQLCGDGSSQATTITFTDMGDVGDITVTDDTLTSGGTKSLAPNKVQDGVSQVDEIQVVECTCTATCSGSFYLSLRGYSSGPIPHDATDSQIKQQLEEALTIDGVSVALTGGTTACDADGVSIAITFTHNSGDVPELQLNSGTLAGGVTPTLTLVHSGTTSSHGAASQTGTKEYVRCNNRGVCAENLGTCGCYTNFASSDGAGGQGLKSDCGYEETANVVCPGTTSCSGHGTCSGADDYTCECYEGYIGGDCAYRSCPYGKAWFSEPGTSLPGFVTVTNGNAAVTTTQDLRSYIFRGDTIVIEGLTFTVDASGTFDATTLTLSSAFSGASKTNAEAYSNPQYAHEEAECSSRGTCDRINGACTCDSGFSGAACERLACPTSISGSTCSGHGRCESLSSLAKLTKVNGVLQSYTYGDDVSVVDTWDKNKVFGCKCDSSLLEGGYYDFTGHDCSERKCPTGDDPSTDGVHEIQTLSCEGTSGSFMLTFREHKTSAISYDGSSADLKSALEALPTISGVTVTIGTGTEVCQDPSVDTQITFTQNLGDLPDMVASDSTVTAVSVAQHTAGTMENIECAARGLCDRTTGVCGCFKQYVSSNGNGGHGTRGDCGMRDALFTGATSSS